MNERRMSFVSDHLIDQIIDGRKTASTEWLDKQGTLDAWDTALEVGAIYTVYDSHRNPRCTVRIVAIELCQWQQIPEWLWRGETNESEQAFQADHLDFFNHPDDTFEFIGYRFELLEVLD